MNNIPAFNQAMVSELLSQFPAEKIERDRKMIKAYQVIIVAFSGGKDSLACLLYLIALGVDLSKVELWHHDIDGHGSDFFDWECTPAYCQAVADAFGIPLYFSYKVNGFEGELIRRNISFKGCQATAFEVPDGMGGKRLEYAGGKDANTDSGYTVGYGFPAGVASLIERWCSGALKIDPASIAINNQSRFKG